MSTPRRDRGLSREQDPTWINTTGCTDARADSSSSAMVAVDQALYVVWDEYRGLKRDIFVNAGTWGLFADDLETGSTSRWSATVTQAALGTP